MKRIMKDTSKLNKYVKIANYMAFTLALSVGACLAEGTLETQVTKASNLMLGNMASLLLGGAAVVGGAIQIKAGNILMGGAVLLVAALTGIGVALIKNQSIFSVLN